MKIHVLVENTSITPNLQTEHGLSLYIETVNHKILFDTGQTGLFARNARLLDIDLTAVDLAVISHGHYDHGGGISHFLEMNNSAPVYLNKKVFGSYYNSFEKYIGLDTELASNERLIFVDNALQIDEELSLFSCNDKDRPYPANPSGLQKMCGCQLAPDDFLHEQYLLISENNKRILVSGCSHKGILNIMNWFEPDVLIGGFHFMKLDPDGEGRAVLENSADILYHYDAIYYTCHCTGERQYAFLKEKMGSRLHYLATGAQIIL